MKNLQRFLLYFAYVLLVSMVVAYGGSIYHYLENLYRSDFTSRYHIWFWTLFPILIGMLTALPQLVFKAKKDGRWGFDWVLFLAVGIPTFYVAITHLTIFFSISNYLPFGYYIIYFMDRFISLFGFVFGFILLAAFIKFPVDMPALPEIHNEE